MENSLVYPQTVKQWHPTPVLLPGKSRGQRSLVGCSPWGHWESDTTEQLHFHFSLSCIGEGNGNPLQCSCLENPRDGEAWWAAVYGVTQSWTRLKRLSSSSSKPRKWTFKGWSIFATNPLILLSHSSWCEGTGRGRGSSNRRWGQALRAVLSQSVAGLPTQWTMCVLQGVGVSARNVKSRSKI